jgi:hypothetical protein
MNTVVGVALYVNMIKPLPPDILPDPAIVPYPPPPPP